MARSNDDIGRDRSEDGDILSPPNLIRERWWRAGEDPPNLQRLTSREAIQERGVAELYERSRGTGIYRGTD